MKEKLNEITSKTYYQLSHRRCCCSTSCFWFSCFIAYVESTLASTGIGGIRFYFPGLGIILSLVVIYLFGLLVTTFVGKWLWNIIDRLLNRLPAIGVLYRTIKEILGYSTEKNTLFQQVVLVPATSGFGEELGLVTEKITNNDGSIKLVVFMPSAPTPTTGRLIFIDEKDVKPLHMSAADTFKALISMGKSKNVKAEILESDKK